MSVENRLREALERSAADFAPRAAGDVEAVITTARRRRAGRRVAMAAAVVLAVGVGAAAVVHQQSGSAAPPVVPAVTASSTSSRAPADRAAADRRLAASLVGTWATGVVSTEDATAAMVRTGTAGYSADVLNQLRLPGAITISFEDLAYRTALDGEVVDEGTWSVHDGKLILAPYCTISCQVVFGPDLNDGVLSLALLEDDSPDVDRIPDAAPAAVVYTSAPFHRPR
jgi:hypothetical protein